MAVDAAVKTEGKTIILFDVEQPEYSFVCKAVLH